MLATVTFMMSIEKPKALGDITGPRIQEGQMIARGTPILLASCLASLSTRICTYVDSAAQIIQDAHLRCRQCYHNMHYITPPLVHLSLDDLLNIAH